MSDVTLLDIARRLGLSKTAVSLALRGKPGLSEATNRRILETARELGYTPNTVAMELMALVREKRQHADVQTIAFFNTFKEPAQMRRIQGIWEFVTGAEQRARQYGYRVEVFETQAPGMNPARLANILQARGVRGILVGPSWATEPVTEFPWERFSAVLLGDPERGAHLHRVCSHQIHGSVTALRALAAKGYKNIGIMLLGRNQRNTGHGYTLGVEQFRRECAPDVRTNLWIYENWDEADCTAWVREHGLDAVVGLDSRAETLFSKSLTPNGDRIGFASLSVFPGEPYSGINQHTEAIGSAAVDLLRGLLLGGERGVALRPQILLVDGEWVEGETTPGPGVSSAAPAASKARSDP